MIICVVNSSQVVLQVTVQNPDGSPKTSLSSADVRVYHLVGVAEVVDLPVTPLSQVSINAWRYIWAPTTLPVGHYWAEYSLIDSDGTHYHDLEDITVQDVATSGSVSDLSDSVDNIGITVGGSSVDIELIKKVLTKRWRIVDKQMIFYDNDNVTPLLTFDLKDLHGLPSNVNVFERDPV